MRDPKKRIGPRFETWYHGFFDSLTQAKTMMVHRHRAVREGLATKNVRRQDCCTYWELCSRLKQSRILQESITQ